MKNTAPWLSISLAIVACLVAPTRATADTTINSFDNFTSDALYASWLTGTIVSGPTSYSVTATGYGSNWKYNPVDGSGYTNIQLTVTLSGAPEADGKLGPIITLVDADGTSCNYAWYGQTLGSHVLNMPVKSPTWSNAAGTVPGLDLATLTHLHLQLDPSTYAGQYTVVWEDLSLTGAAPPVITAQWYDPANRQFTLTWASAPNQMYRVLYSPDLTTAFTPLLTGIPATGGVTTTTVVMPAGNAGYLRVAPE